MSESTQPSAPAAPQPLRGPVGSQRGVLAWIIFTIISFGIMAFVWVWKSHEEVKRYSGIGVGGWVGLLIYIVLSPVTPFLLAQEVGQMVRQDGRESAVSGVTGLWILLPIAGAIVWFVKVQGQLNRFWASKGAPPA